MFRLPTVLREKRGFSVMKRSDQVIDIQNIKRHYVMGDVTVRALDGVSFSVGSGELLAIMGPSGSGKSTMMNLIGCLDTPTSGTILLDGIDVSTMNENSLAAVRNKKIGFVFQQFNLLNKISILENVMTPLLYGGVPFQKRKKMALEALENVGLADRVKHKPVELSGGQKQRVAIARALVTEPSIILADEPTGALDSKTGESILSLFKEINLKGKTVILVTHDHDVAHFCDRLISLKDGLKENKC